MLRENVDDLGKGNSYLEEKGRGSVYAIDNIFTTHKNQTLTSHTIHDQSL